MNGPSSQAEDAVSTAPATKPAIITFTPDTKREIRSPTPIKIIKTLDETTLLAGEAGTYSLTMLDFPPTIDGSPNEQTHKRLTELTEGKKCIVYKPRSEKALRRNRYGHDVAHLTCGKDDVWIQGTLVAEGLARVRTTPENVSQLNKLLELEQSARTKKLGLWALPSNAVLTPATASQHLDSFQIVEGRVYATAQNRESIFLNFTSDWKTDFSIGIPSKLRKDFSKLRIDPMSLRGKTIRVRGWIRNYNGPYIELDHAEPLEVLETPKTETDQTTEKVEKIIEDMLPSPDKKEPAPEKMFMHTIGGGNAPIATPEEPSIEEPTIDEPDLPNIPKPTRPKLATPN